MHTNNGLQSIETVLRGVLLVVDIGFRNDVVLLVAAHQIDVLLAIVIDTGLQAQLLIDGLVESLAEVGHLLDELNQFLQFQAKKYGRCDGTDADGRLLFVQQVCLAEVLAVAQERNPQVFAVRTLADDLSLTAGHNEEALLVLTFLHEQFVDIHLLRLERAHQTVQNLVVELREQRDGLQVLCRKRGHAIHILDGQAVVLAKFHLRAVHAECAA